jgi:hypothetical protein
VKLIGIADEAVREIDPQPELFAGFSEEETEILGAAQGRYTGARALLDEDRCKRICALRVTGMSDRGIEHETGINRRLIPLILEAGEKRGWLAPLRDRVVRKLATVVEMATDEIADTLASGVRDTDNAAWLRAASTALQVVGEHHRLATGQATEIRATVPARGSAADAQMDAWLRVPTVNVTPAGESESPAIPAIPAIPAVVVGADTGADTEQPAGSEASSPAAVAAGSSATQESEARGGAGGVARAGRRSDDDGSSASRNFDSDSQP